MKNNNNRGIQKKENVNTFDSNDYINLTYEDRIKRIISKVNGCIDSDITIINKLGFGGTGTVYKVHTSISGKSVDVAQKVFYTGKEHDRADDDYDELFINWQIIKYISDNIKSIAKDPFLCECIEKIPLLFTTYEQRNILSEEKSLDDQYSAAQKASELKDGIFFEIKGDQNLEDLIGSKIYDLSFEDKKRLLLDILMGATILDKVGIIQRDYNCENIQIKHQLNDGKIHAYLVDFGHAIYKDIIHLYDGDESKKREYCEPFFYSAPPEAFDHNEKEEEIFGDKYNAFNIGLLMFPLFFAKEGQELMFHFKWLNNDDIVHNRKNIFENIDEIVEKFNQNLNNHYTNDQKAFIKSIMSELLNINIKKRKNAETVARKIYETISETCNDSSDEKISYSDSEKCNGKSNQKINLIEKSLNRANNEAKKQNINDFQELPF